MKLRTIRRISITTAAVLQLGLSRIAVGTDASWLSAVSGNWTDPTMWSSNPAYPNNDGSTVFNTRINATGGDYTVSLADPVTVTYLGVNSPNATLSHSAGTLNVETFAVGDDEGGGAYHLGGGTLNVASDGQMWIGGGSSFSSSTTGGIAAFQQTGGWVTTSKSWTIIGWNEGAATLSVSGDQTRFFVPHGCRPSSRSRRAAIHLSGRRRVSALAEFCIDYPGATRGRNRDGLRDHAHRQRSTGHC